MNAEKLILWAVNVLKRGQTGKLYGTITFHFNDGVIQRVETVVSERPVLD